MPININTQLPAAATLAREGIFVMPEDRAQKQDIRPLRLLILNIMPTKEQTETQLIRLLANSPLQVEVGLLIPGSYTPTHTSPQYLDTFYRTFEEVREEYYDGLIITGAPVEQIPFEEVVYWQEFTQILDWAATHVYSTMFICWAAQAAMHHYYGLEKYPLPEKLSGVFRHEKTKVYRPLLRGFDDTFWAPHSRHTEIRRKDIVQTQELSILCEGPECGVYLVSALEGRQIFVTGHPEYTANTLRAEYVRDMSQGLDPKMPKNYFTDDNPELEVEVKWRSHANLLFANWLNYYVYQETPFDIRSLSKREQKKLAAEAQKEIRYAIQQAPGPPT